MNTYSTREIETNSALYTGLMCDCGSKEFTIRMGGDWFEFTCTKCQESHYIEEAYNENE